ncbi:MAG TPA: CHAP domain-containing protein, partial [Candidatus Dormibacteraeota bacterium]|nr:CHAP domain-containing protein [Candidatus Dormibacteraeota bacterium]
MSKQKKQSSTHALLAYRRIALAMGVSLVALLLVSGGFTRLVRAVTCSSVSDCQGQISNLNGQNAQTQASINSLQLQSEGYQSAINTLDAQIGSLEAQISSNQAHQASIEQQIIANQQEIAIKKASLADDVKTMYINGSMTTIEELATSKNLSEYVDKQEYQTVVQNQLTTIIQQITALENTLQQQKAQVDQLLTAQNAQNAQLSAAQAQQAQLLSLNQQQQDSYNAQVSANQHAISALQAQQAAIIQAGTQSLGGGGSGGSGCGAYHGSGGYPAVWCNAYQDSINTPGNFPNRECTSYAFWYFTQVEGHGDFSVSGNANQWLATSNYPTHSVPQVGGLAVETAGTFGHVAVVQALPGDMFQGQTVPAGEVGVSEMNYDF